jgi:NAD(P)-dependent dehydrogenase (short-subunit alcohol dehydrogenase family)
MTKTITELYDFSNRTVVITGGTGVLGRGMALALSACGANVAMLSRNPSRASEVLEQAKGSKGTMKAFAGDVVKKDTLEKAKQEILKAFGRIDFLINAAGGNSPLATTNKDQTFFQLSEQALRDVSELNLIGTILPCQVFGEALAEKKEGAILNVTSVAGVRPLTRVAGYAAAKAAVSNFTKWLAVYMAQEFSPSIRVNGLAPGFFLTEQNRFLLTDEKTGALTERGQKIIAHTPMGRFGKPEDLNGAVLWLLSPASMFVTGIVVFVDGGFSAYSGV